MNLPIPTWEEVYIGMVALTLISVGVAVVADHWLKRLGQ